MFVSSLRGFQPQTVGIVFIFTLLFRMLGFWLVGSSFFAEANDFRVLVFADNLWLSALLSALLVAIGSIWFSHMSNTHDLLNRQSSIPAFVAMLALSSVPSSLVFSNTLLFMLAIVWLVNRTLNFGQMSNLNKEAFNISFFIGIVSILQSEFYLLVLWVWIASFYLNSPKIRFFIISLLALVLPLFLFYSIHFIVYGWLEIKNPFEQFTISVPTPPSWAFVPFVLLALALSSSYATAIRVNTVRVRSAYILFLWLLPFVLAYLGGNANSKHIAVLLLWVPTAMATANYLYYTKSNMKTNVVLLLWFLSAISAWFIL